MSPPIFSVHNGFCLIGCTHIVQHPMAFVKFITQILFKKLHKTH
nr:MAG TPA: hypothetical protein [Caudoviricetes sp.]